MRFVMFNSGTRAELGILDPDEEAVIDLGESGLPPDLTGLLDLGADGLAAAKKAARRGRRLPLRQVHLLAPFPRPRRDLICIGMNYFEHSREFSESSFKAIATGPVIPEAPIIFAKATSTVSGPGDAIPATSDPSGSTDYEGELAVVIGRPGRSIAKDRAYEHVAGYTIVNDVTARRIQQRHKQWFLGKSLDGFCPMGPAFVTADEIGDPTTLRLTTRVNGELRQKGVVKDLIFDIPTIIETISALLTLEVGDIIATGTPAGVGIGFTPPVFLKPGDVVTVEVDRIGVLENPVT